MADMAYGMVTCNITCVVCMHHVMYGNSADLIHGHTYLCLFWIQVVCVPKEPRDRSEQTKYTTTFAIFAI